MNCNSTVAEHGFGPCGGDGDIVAGFFEQHFAVLVALYVSVGLAARQRVLEVPHVTVDLGALDLEVRDRGLEMRVPVDQPLAAVDQPLVVHIHEDLDDGIVEIAFLALGRTGGAGHSESVAGPVAGGAQTAQLVDDRAAGFLLLLPDLSGERLAAQFTAAGLAGGGQPTLDHHLCGDARVILTGLPERVKPLHPVPAHKDVLKRVVEGMAHVQRAGDIRRRDHHREMLVPPRVRAGLKGALGFPIGVDAAFRLGGVEGLFECHGHDPFCCAPFSGLAR